MFGMLYKLLPGKGKFPTFANIAFKEEIAPNHYFNFLTLFWKIIKLEISKGNIDSVRNQYYINNYKTKAVILSVFRIIDKTEVLLTSVTTVDIYVQQRVLMI